MAAGSAYLFAEWPGYIVVPITISGQVVTLGQGEGVVANTNNYINNNTNGSFNVSSQTTDLKATTSITISSTTVSVRASNINIYGNTGVTGTLYMNSNNIEQIRSLYFETTGNINTQQVAGVNYLDINAPNTTGSGTGQLRLFGNKGSLIFDDNIALAGTGSNQVGVYNQYGYMYLDEYQNVYLGGGGSHRGREDNIIVHGLLNSDSRIYTGTSGVGFLQQNGSGFIQTRVDAGAYGGLSMNGYFQVCQTGTTSTIFTVPSDNNQSAWYSNGSGSFGIGTTTPYYKLDVIGDVRVSQDLYANNAVYRNLSATAVAQPVIQYGEDAGSGTSGNITIAIPVAYTSATSYVVFASMMDTGDCKISVNRDSASQITVYWSQAGSGTHKIGWQTSGT
jgi:hypothetical protein